MSGVAKVSYFGRTAWNGIARAPFVHAIAVLAIAISLVGFGVARLLSMKLDSLLQVLGGDVELTVYIKDEATPEARANLKAALEKLTQGTANLVPPDEALGRLRAALGPKGETLASLRSNPLPWSLEIRVPAGIRAADELTRLAARTRELSFVDGVDFGEAAVERLTTLNRAVRWGALVVFALVFLTTIVVVSVTLQLAIYARRDEIEIQKLVGATDPFVRAPFLIEGVIQGLLGALVAVATLFAIDAWLGPRAKELLAFINTGPSADIQRLFLEMGLAGILLGFFGSLLAVRRFLRV